MKAGREIDALVGTYVFGYIVVEHKSWARPDKHYQSGQSLIVLPTYSTNLHCAYEVIEHMSKLGCDIRLSKPSGSDKWQVRISEHEGTHSTLPVAICLAALKMARAMRGLENTT